MVRRGDVIAEKYLVEEPLGEGGMGAVYAARHVVLGERFALKVLNRPASAHHAARQINEARALGRMRSERAVRIHDVVWSADGAPVLVLELLRGRDLGAVLEADGALLEARAVGYVLDACEAVAEAHALGVLHRDLKPKNLFLVTPSFGEASVRIIDFGVAKDLSGAAPELTADGAFAGSPSYASPEQARGEQLDQRTDVWSLGVVLFELVVGEPPFRGGSLDVLNAITTRDAPELASVAPTTSRQLSQIVARCLRRDRVDRWDSVVALATELAPLVSDGEQRLERLRAIVAAAEERRAEAGTTVDPLPTPDGPPRPIDAARPRPTLQPWIIAAVAVGALVPLAILVMPGAVPAARARAFVALPQPAPAVPVASDSPPPLVPQDVVERAEAPKRADRRPSQTLGSPAIAAASAGGAPPGVVTPAHTTARSFDDLVQTRR